MKNKKTGKTWQLTGTAWRPDFYSLMSEVTLGSLVLCSVNGSVFEGIVTTITMQGLVLDNHGFDTAKLVKWCNVVELKEKTIKQPNDR